MANATSASTDSKRMNKEWLPSTTPKYTFAGHRDKINAVAFHPTYSVVASASVDATIKIWDWDSGDLERTLKSHTKAVSDCRYDSAGKVLGTFFPIHCSRPGVKNPIVQLLVPTTYSSSYGMCPTITRTLLLSEGTNIRSRAFASCLETTT